jgi:hypothetical protein
MESTSTGSAPARFAGANGEIYLRGAVDLGKGELVLPYSGKVCLGE